MKIERVRAGQVEVGESICDVDDDTLTNDDAINDAYDAETADWNVVCRRRGHADVGEFLVQMYNGERVWTPSQSWDVWVWRLADDDGTPIVDEDVWAEARERG